MTSDRIIEAAMTWRGTPWRHNAVLKGYGTDCLQFIVVIGKEIGVIPLDYQVPKYHADWSFHNNESIIKREIVKFCDPVDAKERGDILLFINGKCAAHAGIYIGDERMISAEMRNGVAITELKGYKLKLESIWRVK